MKQNKLMSCLRLVSVVLTGMFFFSPACGAFGKTVVAMSNHGLIFEIRLDKSEYHSGEKIFIDLVLKNIGNSPICINSRMAVNHKSAPPQYREIELFLERRGGNRIDFDCKVNIRRATGKEYKILQPGESITRRYEMTNCFQFKKTGEYTVKANFQDGTKAVDRLNDIPIFSERIESGCVNFVLK